VLEAPIDDIARWFIEEAEAAESQLDKLMLSTNFHAMGDLLASNKMEKRSVYFYSMAALLQAYPFGNEDPVIEWWRQMNLATQSNIIRRYQLGQQMYGVSQNLRKGNRVDLQDVDDPVGMKLINPVVSYGSAIAAYGLVFRISEHSSKTNTYTIADTDLDKVLRTSEKIVLDTAKELMSGIGRSHDFFTASAPYDMEISRLIFQDLMKSAVSTGDVASAIKEFDEKLLAADVYPDPVYISLAVAMLYSIDDFMVDVGQILGVKVCLGNAYNLIQSII